MFDVAPSEFMLVAVLALLVIGPKDLPKMMRIVGHWVGKARRVAGHFRSGIDEMIRQSELEEMEKKWAAENQRIMNDAAAMEPISKQYDSLPPPDAAVSDAGSPEKLP